MQKVQIGHQYETRGPKCDYAPLRLPTVTLGLTGLRAAPVAQRTARLPADACALASGSGVVAVDGGVVVEECKRKDALEDGVEVVRDSEHFLSCRVNL